MPQTGQDPTAPEVKGVRLSLIWVEPILNLMFVPRPDGPLGQIGTDDCYAMEYQKAHTAAGTELTLPWPRPTGQLFWTRYFNGTRPGDLAASDAWHALVPLRRLVAPALVDRRRIFRMLAEILVYPFGLALAITAWGRGGDLDETVQRAVGLRKEPGRVCLGNGPAISIDAAADELLTRARQELFGLQVGAGPRTVDPFSIVTVVRGTNVSAAEVPTDRVRQALHALCSWQEDWQSLDPLPSQADLVLSRTRQRKGHVIYALDRGRAVWFPARFGASRKSYALTCYHRNLTWASLQTEALAAFAAATAHRLGPASPDILLQVYGEKATEALNILEELRDGAPTRYRSSSIRRQIDDNWLNPLNEARAKFGLPPLS
jgi:hypothetical protein